MAVPLQLTSVRARPYLPAAGLAAAAGAVTLVVAEVTDLPLRDPDGVAGPAYVRLPLILLILLALDVIPRAVHRAQGRTEWVAQAKAVTRERWPAERVKLAFIGLMSFYVTYVAYRNLKSFLPSVREGTADTALLALDRAMSFGVDPAKIIHTALGTGISAHLLSVVYLFFLIFVPISLAAALVWTSDVARGYWYVTALGINWILGVASYYVLPSLGPIFAQPSMYTDLPTTGVSRLQLSLLDAREAWLMNPASTSEVHGIAGFASLHVAIVFTAALMGELVGLPRALRRGLWAFFGLTVVATIYFGWHYLIDDVGGLAIGLLAVVLGGMATGHDVPGMLRARFRREPALVGRRT